MTGKEKELCLALSKSGSKDASEVMALSKMKQSNYQNYRAALLDKGILEVVGYGKIDFALPRFDRFIEANRVYYLL